MKLVGMLDSPFVRRAFISGRMLGIPFEHQSLSVLRQVEEFRALNPLVKAPTLVFDDGEVMVDSSQIITLFESLAAPGSSLLAAVQNSMLALHDLAPASLPLQPADRSIELHVCHGLTRELEVLHDQLLQGRGVVRRGWRR